MDSSSQTQHFPLMRLPLALRYQVYREVLSPEYDDSFMDPKNPNWHREPPNKDNIRRINLLLANKQTHDEASEILYKERLFKVQLDGLVFLNFHGKRQEDKRSRIAPPERWPKIYNLEICMSGLHFLSERRLGGFYGGIETLAHQVLTICYEITSRELSLKTLVIDLHCPCQNDNHFYDDNGDPKDCGGCITVEEFELLTKPLRKVREYVWCAGTFVDNPGFEDEWFWNKIAKIERRVDQQLKRQKAMQEQRHETGRRTQRDRRIRKR
ncbi:MAG: hypothetical protein Q9170_004229 [Blastenia crenularia]